MPSNLVGSPSHAFPGKLGITFVIVVVGMWLMGVSISANFATVNVIGINIVVCIRRAVCDNIALQLRNLPLHAINLR